MSASKGKKERMSVTKIEWTILEVLDERDTPMARESLAFCAFLRLSGRRKMSKILSAIGRLRKIGAIVEDANGGLASSRWTVAEVEFEAGIARIAA